MSDRGMNFLNEKISMNLEEFHVYHQKSMSYHPQANSIVEVFNKILENSLKKVCNVKKNDWDVHTLVVLWAYRMAYKKLIRQTSFTLACGIEALVLMEYIVTSLQIASLIKVDGHENLEERSE